MENQNTNDQKNFTNHMAKALVTVLLGILYLLKLPYDLWSQATLRLSEQGDKGIKISNFKGKWPMLSFMKFWLLEFGFDASIFLCYIIGPIMAIVALIITPYEPFMAFVFTLIFSYLAPLYYMLMKDIFQILILPFKKFIDWAKKPAQHMQVEHSGELKR